VTDALTAAARAAGHDLTAALPSDIRAGIIVYGSAPDAPAPLHVTVFSRTSAAIVIAAMPGVAWASVSTEVFTGTWRGVGVRVVIELPPVHHYDSSDDRLWLQHERAEHPVTDEQAAEVCDLAHRQELVGAL
jgi:hypothetical protein